LVGGVFTVVIFQSISAFKKAVNIFLNSEKNWYSLIYQEYKEIFTVRTMMVAVCRINSVGEFSTDW